MPRRRYDATVVGATQTAGRFGSDALLFGGAGGQYISFSVAMSAQILLDWPRTICLWARVDAFDNGILFFYGARRRGRRRVQDTF